MKTYVTHSGAAGSLRGCGQSTHSLTGAFVLGASLATLRADSGVVAAGPRMAGYLMPSAVLASARLNPNQNNSKTRIAAAGGASGSHPDWDPV